MRLCEQSSPLRMVRRGPPQTARRARRLPRRSAAWTAGRRLNHRRCNREYLVWSRSWCPPLAHGFRRTIPVAGSAPSVLLRVRPEPAEADLLAVIVAAEACPDPREIGAF